jgi:TldD protein
MQYQDIGRHAGLFTEYTELRVQRNRSSTVALLKGDVMLNDRSSTGGVSARVFKDGVWGFASDPVVSDGSIAGAVRLATGNARFLASKAGSAGHALPRAAACGGWDLSTKKRRLSQGDILDFARQVDNHIARAYPKLISRQVVISCLDMEKTLLTSEGATAWSLIPRSLLYATMSMEDSDGNPVEVFEIFGKGGRQFEDAFETPAALEPILDGLHRHLAAKAQSVYPAAGPQKVILGPDLTGTLAHEAIGHTVEGDLVLGGSVAGDNLGKPVASELVTLVDFANTALGETCPVPLWIDDEGTPGRDAVLIERGMLKSFMHNKETAMRLGMEPTGNARAFTFADEPLVRMRNTAILPGDSKLEDMIAAVDDGYYLMRSSNGQADSTGEFMFGVVLGYEIKKGKLGRALRDTTVSGVAFDMLKTVTAVSGDMSWSAGGMCGKKQPIPVGMGGPAIACTINLGGR